MNYLIILKITALYLVWIDYIHNWNYWVKDHLHQYEIYKIYIGI